MRQPNVNKLMFDAQPTDDGQNGAHPRKQVQSHNSTHQVITPQIAHDYCQNSTYPFFKAAMTPLDEDAEESQKGRRNDGQSSTDPSFQATLSLSPSNREESLVRMNSDLNAQESYAVADLPGQEAAASCKRSQEGNARTKIPEHEALLPPECFLHGQTSAETVDQEVMHCPKGIQQGHTTALPPEHQGTTSHEHTRPGHTLSEPPEQTSGHTRQAQERKRLTHGVFASFQDGIFAAQISRHKRQAVQGTNLVSDDLAFAQDLAFELSGLDVEGNNDAEFGHRPHSVGVRRRSLSADMLVCPAFMCSCLLLFIFRKCARRSRSGGNALF